MNECMHATRSASQLISQMLGVKDLFVGYDAVLGVILRAFHTLECICRICRLSKKALQT